MSLNVFKSAIQFKISMLKIEINNLEEYISSNEEILKERRSILNKETSACLSRMEDQKRQLDIDDIPDPYSDVEINYYYDEYVKLQDIFPTYFYNSSLIMMYSFFEYTLKDICNTCTNLKGFPQSTEDFPGKNYIMECKKWLSNIVGLNLKEVNPVFTKITTYQSIRNCIVHNNCKVEKPHIMKIVESCEYLTLNRGKDAFMITDPQILIDFSMLIKEYLNAVLNRLILIE